MRYILTFLLLLTFAGGAAHAQEQLGIFEKELLAYEILPEEEYAKQSVLFEKTPLRDKSLAFEVRLPKDWQETKSFGYALSNKVPVEAAKYNGPVKFNQQRSFLTIYAQELDYQTSAEEWFTSFAFKNGHIVRGATVHSDTLVEALHVEYNLGESYVVRSLTVINGSRLIQVLYYMPVESWSDEHVLQNQVINSFKLVNARGSSVHETLPRFDFLDIASVQYPGNWQFTPSEDRSLDSLGAELLHFDVYTDNDKVRIVNGDLKLMIRSDYVLESLSKGMQDYKDGLAVNGFVIQDSIDSAPADISFPSSYRGVEIQALSVLDPNYPRRQTELWLVGAQNGEYKVIYALLTPSRESQFGIWTRNMKAMKTVIDHLVFYETD